MIPNKARTRLAAIFFAAVWLIGCAHSASPAPKPVAIGILPLQPPSGKTNQAWLVAAFSDCLRQKLSKISGIYVIPVGVHTRVINMKAIISGEVYKDTKQIVRLGRRMNARFVIAGACSDTGSKISATAWCVDIASQRISKKTQVQGSRDDLFDIQNRLTLALVRQLGIKPTPAEVDALTNARRASVSVFEFYASGLIAMMSGDNAEATRCFAAVITEEPNWPDALFMHGLAYQLKGAYDLAFEDYTAVLKLDPNHVQARSQRGVLYHEKGDYARAIDDLTMALKIDPGDTTSREMRGECYAQLNKYDQAIPDLSRAIAVAPRAAVLDCRAIAYLNQGKLDAALADCNRSIALDPRRSDAYLSRGWVYECKEMPDRAVIDFTTAIKLDPKCAIAYFDRGCIYGVIRRYDRALADYGKAIRLDPKLHQAYANRGATFRKMKSFSAAIADCNKALELEPSSGQAYATRAEAYLGKGDCQQALADATKALQLEPRLLAAYQTRAGTYLDLGQIDKAWNEVATMRIAGGVPSKELLDRLKNASAKRHSGG